MRARYLGKLMSHLVNEGGKFVVEGLDLFLLTLTDILDVGVNLQLEGFQKALVDGNFVDAPIRNSREPRATHATTKPKGTTRCATKTIGNSSSSTKTCRSIEATTPSSYGDPIASTDIVEAPASKTSTKSSIPSSGAAASTLGS